MLDPTERVYLDPFLRLASSEPDDTRLPTIEELVACPPTEACEAASREASQLARECPDDSPRKGDLERRASRAIALVKRARRRDLDLTRRREQGPEYADCVCLGQ